MKKFVIAVIALLLTGGASAQKNSCASQNTTESGLHQNLASGRNCPVLLAAYVAIQQSSMPAMQSPGQKMQQGQPPQVSPPGTAAMQTSDGANSNMHDKQQSIPQQTNGLQGMQMKTPEQIPSHVEDLQEPENPDQQTGGNLPIPDLLKEAKAAPAKKVDEFELLAAQNNPTLRQAQTLIQNSAGLARQAGLWPNPSIGYQGEQIRGGDFGGGEQGGFLQQTIVLGGKLGLRRNVFEQERKADEAGLEEQQLNVVGGVRAQFYTALAQLRSVEIQRQLLQVAMDAAATAHQLANVGQADAPDILQAEVEAEQEKLNFSAAQQDYIQSYHQLAAIVGQPQLPLSLLEGDLENPPEIDPNLVVESILQNSPSVKRAEQEANRAEATLKRDKREAIPDLIVRAGIQENFEQDPVSLRRVGGQGFATASMQIPIFNRNQGNVEAAKAEVERNQQEVLRIKLSLARATQLLIQRYLTDKLQVERYRTQMIPRAHRAYQLYLEKYRNMAAAYPEVIISQRTMFQLDKSYTQTLAELWRSSIQLQNYLLVDGLTAPQPTGNTTTQVNLPTGGVGSSE